MSVSARSFWVLVGLVALCAVLIVALPLAGFRMLFGRSPAQEFDTLVRNVDPTEIQQWAVELLRQFPHGTNGVFYQPGITNSDSGLVFSNTPAFLRHVSTFGAVGPEVLISPGNAEANRCVELVYFYGGWGNGQSIVAGRPGFTMATNWRCIFWAPGVYYRVW